jgi:uncharacterized damage-inducible protein DinB
MKEIERIADQFTRAVEGNAWHGPALLEVLKDITAAHAFAKPYPDIHSIWEIVLHISAWHLASIRRLAGNVLELTNEEDWPAVDNSSESAWKSIIENMVKSYQQLKQKILSITDKDLKNVVPGKDHSVYVLLHGVIQHDLYHAGQIALLRKKFW